MTTSTVSHRTGRAGANRRPTGGVFAALTVVASATAAGAVVLMRKPHRELRPAEMVPLPG